MCTDQISERRFVSKSTWAADVERRPWRFCLTITNVAKKMDSRLTTIVKRPNWNLSNSRATPSAPTLTVIQTANQAVWMYTNLSEPANAVMRSAARSRARLRIQKGALALQVVMLGLVEVAVLDAVGTIDNPAAGDRSAERT